MGKWQEQENGGNGLGKMYPWMLQDWRKVSQVQVMIIRGQFLNIWFQGKN